MLYFLFPQLKSIIMLRNFVCTFDLFCFLVVVVLPPAVATTLESVHPMIIHLCCARCAVGQLRTVVFISSRHSTCCLLLHVRSYLLKVNEPVVNV